MTCKYEEHTPIDVLVPYDKNPRIITQAAVDAVARSIKAYSFNEPIIADENGVILAGHNRLKAARQLGLTHVPVLWVDDLTAQKARAYRIADNRTAEFAQWDRPLLDEELKGLIDDGETDLEPLCVEQWELDRLSKAYDDERQPGSFIPGKAGKPSRGIVDDDGERIDSAPKAPGKPLSPPSVRILIIIENDDDKAACRKALGLKASDDIPAVIRFSEVKR